MERSGLTQPASAGRTKRRALCTSECVRLILAGLVLMALPFVLFWQVWWPDTSLRRVFAYGDFVEQHYPMRSFVASELRQGRLPLWDPYTFSGGPANAQSIFGMFYPLGLWQALFPWRLPFLALQLQAVAHLGLAGLFTCLFVRQLTGRIGAGLLAGLAFSLGGFLTSYPMLQIIILEAAVWLPATLWLLEVALARRSLWLTALAGTALGVSLLTGFPQILLYSGYVIASYLLLRAWHLRLGWRFTLAAALTLGATTLGLSAMQWLPSLEMLPLSPRTGLSYEIIAAGFHPRELWGLLRPNPGQWSPLYVGLIPLGLALAAPALSRRGETWYWVVVAALALALSVGGHGFLYPLAYRLAPGFSLFRQQERIAFLVNLSLAVLAGYGYAALAGRRWWLRPALVFVDLFRVNGGVILQAPPPGGYFAPTPVLQHLQQVDDRVARVSSEGLLPGGGNAGLAFRIRDVTGSGPLYLASHDRFMEKVPEVRWFQMLNVRYLVTQRRVDYGAFRLLVDEGDKRLYELSALGGRPAWIVHAYEVARDPQAAIELTAEPALNPFDTAILEQQPSIQLQPARGAEHAQVTSFERHRVAVEAELTAPGILVLSEVFYPGWVARVDGRPLTTLRAYGLLRAVALPAGRWHVVWQYEPWPFRIGAVLTGLTVAALIALWFWERRARRPATAAGVSVPSTV